MTRQIIAGIAILASGLAISLVVAPVPANEPLIAGNAIEASVEVPPEIMLFLRGACYDCHSHETRWPWYSRVPVVSSVLFDHVRSGKSDLNFSDWSTDPVKEPTPDQRLGGICYDATQQIMPPRSYRAVHRSARLSAGDIRQLCEWSAVARQNLRRQNPR